MKKFRIFLLLACLSLMTMPVVVFAETITLSLSDQNSDMSWGPVHATQPWVKKVEEVTKGRVKIQIYPNQTLAKGPQNWKAVTAGIADMSWFILGFAPGMAPYAEVLQLPGLPFNTGEAGSELAWKMYEKFPEIQKELSENQVLVLYTSPPMKLLLAKAPVKTLADMKGLKIRTHAGPVTEAVKDWGAVPVMIPMPDCYLAMQKGTIDAISADWEPIPGFRLNEVTKYITTNVPLNAALVCISMNKKKWDSLPKDVQDAIMSVSGLWGSKYFGRNFFDSSKEPIIKMIEEGKYDIKINALSEEEREKWVEVGARPAWDGWVKRMESKGFTKAKEILNAATKK
jgi:TRAP-type C4-dicarboxylate transport system substrate-binding protein